MNDISLKGSPFQTTERDLNTSFFNFRASLETYGNSQASAATYTKASARADSLPHCPRQEIEPRPPQQSKPIAVGFLTHCVTGGTPKTECF